MTYLSGKIYPDRTFSLGCVAPPKKKKEEKVYDDDHISQYSWYTYTTQKYGRTEYHTEWFFDRPITPNGFTKSEESSQKREKRVYGQKGITSFGKKSVSNAVLLIEKAYGKSRINFVTCTLPGYPDHILHILNCNWSDIVRKFFQAVRRELKKVGAPQEYVATTEVQEKRLKSGKGLALHLHFVYVCRPSRNYNYYISIDRMTELWYRQIRNVIRIHAEGFICWYSDFVSAVDMQIVKKSASGYIGKYMSKGVKACKKIIENGLGHCLPSQWWTASMQAKARLKKAIIDIPWEIAIQLFYNIHDFAAKKEVLNWEYAECEYAGENRIFGLAGKMSEGLYSYVKLYSSCR